MSGTLALYELFDYPSLLINSKWFNGKYRVKIECEIELKGQVCTKLND
ncbi:hypothetical protein F383_33124 [Gossypium arboreum]|uniref:Uncharacterized protein n=1 Tax=Gossypium arboreum TaxID=29729 RepID=A0A0B0PN54_GOSAR|nr:hypothetical protein F383_33124 [Gossypium arboreum]